MVQLPSSARVNGAQKFFAYALMAVAAFFVIKGVNRWILPELEFFVKHLALTMAIGAIPVYLIGYAITHPLIIWGFFKTLSYKLTYWLIKQDPLSVMDRYVEYLKKKLGELGATVKILTGKKIKLDRKIAELQGRMEDNLKLGNSAIKQGKTTAASTFGTKVQTDENTLGLLIPLQTRINKSLGFLQGLQENWQYGIEKLEYQIDGKRQEYEIIRETTKGLKSTEAFINSDNEAARAYGMGLKALEEEVTQKLGYIEEFNRNSKGIMDAINIEKQSNQDEGLAKLEKYMQNGKITMPDFSKIGGIQDIDYQTVPVQSSNGASKFNLLGK